MVGRQLQAIALIGRRTVDRDACVRAVFEVDVFRDGVVEAQLRSAHVRMLHTGLRPSSRAPGRCVRGFASVVIPSNRNSEARGTVIPRSPTCQNAGRPYRSGGVGSVGAPIQLRMCRC